MKIICVLFVFLISFCFTETIHLIDGTKVKGKIIENTNDYLRMQTDSGIIYFDKKNIKEIDNARVDSGKEESKEQSGGSVFYLKNGTIITGKIIEEKDVFFKVENNEGVFVIDKINIKKQDKTKVVPEEAKENSSIENSKNKPENIEVVIASFYTLILKDGKIVKGKIIDQTESIVKIETTDGIINIDKLKIKKIFKFKDEYYEKMIEEKLNKKHTGVMTFVLKTGQKIKGEIISETKDSTKVQTDAGIVLINNKNIKKRTD